jgi:hypothetical protein
MDRERAGAPRQRVIERARPVPVVEEHEPAPFETAREPAMELRGSGADLGDLSGLERDPETGEGRRPLLRRRFGVPDESFSLDTDAELLEASRGPTHPYDRESVEELVGEDPPAHRVLRDIGKHAKPARLEIRAGGRGALHRGESGSEGDVPCVPLERCGKGGEKSPLPGPRLDERHSFSFRSTGPQQLARVPGEEAGDRRGECRRHRRRGDEVAALSDRCAAGVIAGLGIVEGGFHEVGEGDRSLAPDAPAQALRER